MSKVYFQKLFFPVLFPVISLILIITGSCENDIQKINSLTSDLKLPDQSGEDIEIYYSDSGKLEIRFFTPELMKYDKVKEPYILFPKGVEVFFYDDSMKIESMIKSKYAYYYQEKRLWKVTNDVEAKNLKTGEQLNTEELYWDEIEKRVYSDKFSKITNEDGVFFGENGFEANQDLSKWKLKGSKGSVNIEDEK